MNTENTGKLIAGLRKEKGWTQKELALKLHVTDKAVSKWERGKSMPDLSLLPNLCEILDIGLLELLSGEQGKTDMELKDSVSLVMNLIDGEKMRKAKKLNWYFAIGLFFLLAVLIPEYIQLTGYGEESPLGMLEAGLLLCLGLAFEIAGFYYNNKGSRNKTFTTKEIQALTAKEEDVRMKTAGEMLSFAGKYQKTGFKQYRLAFEEIAKRLQEDEYAVFSMVADSYSLNDSPGPWHISLAVTNSRIMLSGELVRGRMFTRYALDSFELEDIISIKMGNRKIMIKTLNATVKMEGENLDSIFDRMKEHPVLAPYTHPY